MVGQGLLEYTEGTRLSECCFFFMVGQGLLEDSETRDVVSSSWWDKAFWKIPEKVVAEGLLKDSETRDVVSSSWWDFFMVVGQGLLEDSETREWWDKKMLFLLHGGTRPSGRFRNKRCFFFTEYSC
ncbi:hypothetical protein CEXT_85081 [Caerostris extrusa]|uniref:Uncharacterized protein n=1 Tax=Caerostris extrusa TaxID=172846 RepID=A0AAV4R0Z8_CAEEX|nr:hypothetical protein CEXT_85081 [Caerostris extrusa]